MPHTIAVAAAGLAAAMSAAGLTAWAGVAAPMTTASLVTASAARSTGPAGQAGCVWAPPLPMATTTDPVGQPLYPCDGPK
jgi:hypothetical protein